MKRGWLMGLALTVSLAGEAADAAYPTPSQVKSDINEQLKKSQLEKVEFTSKWALSWVDMVRRAFQPPDQAVCDVVLTFVKDAKGEQGSSEAVVYYTRDVARPHLPWAYQKVDILTTKLAGRPDMTQEEMAGVLLGALANEPRAQRMVLPQPARLTKVFSVGAADPSEFTWKSRDAFGFKARIEYQDTYGKADVRRMERVIRVGFEKRDTGWFMNDIGSAKDTVVSTVTYAKPQVDAMKTLAQSTWAEVYAPQGAGSAAGEPEVKPYPPAKDIIQAISQGVAASEKHFNQILGAKVVGGKLEIEDLASRAYEISVKEEDVDFKDFKWGKDGGFSLPVRVTYWWKEVKERKAGPTLEKTYYKNADSESYMMMFKPSAKGGVFVSGSVGQGMKKSLMNSRIGESTFGSLPATFHERFAPK